MSDSELRSILGERIASVRARIAAACVRTGRDPSGVTLVGVSKTVSPAVAAVAASLGLTDLGENRPQELWRKADAVTGANWHFIGHLQRNKLDRTAPLVSLMHSVDSERLLTALDAFGRARGAPLPVLLEVNCSGEEAKGGFKPIDALGIGAKAARLTGVTVRGLMTMAAYTDDPQQARPTFRLLRELRDSLQTHAGLALPDLSMGMSGDFEVAVEEGATLVRVGTTLFDGLGMKAN